MHSKRSLYINLVRRAKSEALDNIYCLLILNIKSCNAKTSGEGNETAKVLLAL